MPARLAVLALLLAAACSNGTVGDAPADGWSTLATQLRSAGETLQDGGEIEQPFWTRSARVFTTADGEMQVYEFSDEAGAAAAAAEVSPTGGSIGAFSASWMAPPHYFRRGRVIVLYLGSNESTLRRLAAVLGPQFAGQ